MIVKFDVRSHLLTFFAEVPLLLMDHGFRDLLLFKLLSFVSSFGIGCGLEARLEELVF